MAQIKAIEDKKAFPNSNLNWIHNKLIQIVIHNTLENTKGKERERYYVSHEFLNILGVVSEGVHKNDGNGHINPELRDLQNSLWSSHIWHFFPKHFQTLN
jgi:predicted subunit of tRNA(5-methylaminomethyl-2-thiouridylate) methyltransferase